MATVVKDFTVGDVRPGDVVVIFGGAEIAAMTHYALGLLGIEVSYFCDLIPERQGSRQRGLDVLSPAALEHLDAATTCVFDCGDHRQYPRHPAFLDRLSRVFVSASLLARTDFGSANMGLDEAELERAISLYRIHCREVTEPDKLRLTSLDVVVTEACSMRCIDCANLMQYYTKPRHSDLDELCTAVDRLMTAVTGVDEFRVLGGEPFTNPRMWRVVDKLVEIDGTENVVVYTNGTIVPRDQNLTCLQHPKVTVYITNYADLSRRHDELTEELTHRGIRWLSRIPSWTDSGRITRIDRTEEELQRVFAECSAKDLMTLLNGRLYNCPFSANAMNLAAVPAAPADVIDLRVDRPAEELTQLVGTLYNRARALTACAFCNGRDHTTPAVTPAIQTRRPLPLMPV